MCIIRDKIFTCGHLARPKKEICRTAHANDALCDPITELPKRMSQFPCFDCIRDDVRKEKEAAFREAEKERGWTKAGGKGGKGKGLGGGGGKKPGWGFGAGLGIDMGGGASPP
jgi:hypothetical protein